MLKTKLHTKDYTEFNDNFQLILPLNLENLIPEDDAVRLLSHVLEGLDYRKMKYYLKMYLLMVLKSKRMLIAIPLFGKKLF
jgi:transposase